MTTPELFLFVSHVSEDRSAAMQIVAELERRGVRCWIAPRDVRPGKPFDDEIADAIDASWAMLLIFSERCNESEYIRREVTVAGESHKVIIPFRIEDAPLRRGLRVRLSDLHWIDGFASWERGVDELIRTLHPVQDEAVVGAAADQRLRERPPAVIDTPGTSNVSRAKKEPRRRETETEPQGVKARRLRDEAEARLLESKSRPSLRTSQARSLRLLSRPALIAGSLIGLALLGVIGIWLSRESPSPDLVTEPSLVQHVQDPSGIIYRPGFSLHECTNCPIMNVVPAGRFVMGSPTSEVGRGKYEGPQHRVTIARPFAVSKFQLSFDEWDACVADGGCNSLQPYDEGWGRGRLPVINVSWEDAKTYVAWLSKKTRSTYRLLTESEREYVTRAGTTTPFWWGNSIATNQANYDGASTYADGAKGELRKRTVPVDSFAANPWDLYQVHGNVWEWVEDCAHDSYDGAPGYGTAWTSGDCGRRVVRGGSWQATPVALRSAARWDLPPTSGSPTLAFGLPGPFANRPC